MAAIQVCDLVELKVIENIKAWLGLVLSGGKQ
jgi:hypothetical protein